MNPTSVGSKIFHCVDCNCEVIEEVATAVVVSTQVEGINENGGPSYGKILDTADCGEIARLQCSDCGAILAEGNEAFDYVLEMSKNGDPNFRDPDDA